MAKLTDFLHKNQQIVAEDGLFSPEYFQSELLDNISADEYSHSEMAPVERRFLHGLLRYFRPRNILELGVAAGGGSRIILNAIEDNPEAKLVSIDLMTHWYRDVNKKVGHDALRAYPQGNSQWDLYPGRDASEIIEALAKDIKFDFVVLDTVHEHPGETLNLLSVLPFLTEDAIVVLHDIAYHQSDDNLYPFLRNNACVLLFNTIVADKLTPHERYYGDGYFPNIGAFQLNADTHKYICNLFWSLRSPWGVMPSKIESIRSIIHRYYDEQCVKIFETTLAPSVGYLMNDGRSYDLSRVPDLSQYEKIIFYGAGARLQNAIEIFQFVYSRLPDEIWDINADEIGERFGVPVKKPAFEQLSPGLNDKWLMVITILQESVTNAVSEQLRANGFTNFVLVNRFGGLSIS